MSTALLPVFVSSIQSSGSELTSLMRIWSPTAADAGAAAKTVRGTKPMSAARAAAMAR
jgi:hypothetical protein